MLRVADFEAVLEFYTRALDVRLLWCRDYPDGRFILASAGYQDECVAAVLELTHNWDRGGYTQDDDYDHLAIEVGDAAATCARVRALGHRVTHEVGSMQHGRSVTVLLEDPDGYKMKLTQKSTQFD